MNEFKKYLIGLFHKAPSEHLVKAEDWIIDPDWSKWTLTKVVIPWKIHRDRMCVGRLIDIVDGNRFENPLPFRVIFDCDDEDNLIVSYDKSNYPLEPRQEFTLVFL